MGLYCVVAFLFFILGFADDPGNTFTLCSLARGLAQDNRFSSPSTISLFLINTSILISLRGPGKGTKIHVCVCV